jgi:fatty acid desaturase
MPLFLTWQYGVSVGVAFLAALLTHRMGTRRGLTAVATLAIVVCLWVLGRHPLGFLVSIGGWLMFALTLLVAKAIDLVVINIGISSQHEDAH